MEQMLSTVYTGRPSLSPRRYEFVCAGSSSSRRFTASLCFIASSNVGAAYVEFHGVFS